MSPILNPAIAFLSFYVIVAAFGLVGFLLLIAFGLRTNEAWLGGRMVGMLMVTYPAWWAGVLGITQWQTVGVAILIPGSLFGLWVFLHHRGEWRTLVGAETIFLLGSTLVLLMRLPHAQILGTEKLMDLGILTTLLRTPSFPPPDMWFAGETLPYYYWGTLPWVLPIKLSAIPVAYAYNFIVAMLGGITFSLAWALGARLSQNSQWSGALVAFLSVFAGTFDGLRQFLLTHSFARIDLWRSSRQNADVITEFPLFSFWLGDLHPHLLSIPMTLLALLLALTTGQQGPRVWSMIVIAVLLGLTGAANPWAFLPTFVAVLLLLITGDGLWRWPWERPGYRWLFALPLLVGALLAAAPFFFTYTSPYNKLAVVQAHTILPELFLYAGIFLLPLGGATFSAVRTWQADADVGRFIALSLFVTGVIVAIVTGRPTLVILGILLSLLFAETSHPEPNLQRPALALACLGTGLFLIPEIVYVVDPYGSRLHRMNTVFKAYIQAWIFLSLAWPVLMQRWLSHPVTRRLVIGMLLAMSLPHLIAVYGQLRRAPLSLDGFAWLSADDQAAIEFLSRQPSGITVIEAVGDAYSRYARISAAAGVPAYLGWENHESVWRGPQVRPRLEDRRKIVTAIYTSGDPEVIRHQIREAGVDYVVIGTLERERYPSEALTQLRAAGTVAFQHGETVLLSFAHPQ